MTMEDLWETLHQHAELSNCEKDTKKILKEYLATETDVQVFDRGPFLYALHDENAEHTVAVRADMDAIPGRDGKPFHGCGHDGHMAMACGAAKRISGRKTGKNVIFLFQPAEEIGSGARTCFPLFSERRIDCMLGLHNIPGKPLGEVLLRKGTFADASLGLTITMRGKQSHAACPEQGLNPGFVMADVITKLGTLTRKEDYEGFVLATLVYARAGEKNFGISAGDAELCLTLRAERTGDLEKLREAVLVEARISAAVEEAARSLRGGIEIGYAVQDEFPATQNDPADAARVWDAFHADGLPVSYLDAPMRWSEDFGCYREKTHTFFFGIGSGEDCCGLHTDSYVFPKALIPRGAEVWEKMIGLF